MQPGPVADASRCIVHPAAYRAKHRTHSCTRAAARAVPPPAAAAALVAKRRRCLAAFGRSEPPSSVMSEPRVVLYATSVPTLQKVRADIATIKRILEGKKVAYEEVDLTRTPERREEMVAASNERIIPQVHVNGKYIGNADLIQELEDFGQLDEVLRQP